MYSEIRMVNSREKTAENINASKISIQMGIESTREESEFFNTD